MSFITVKYGDDQTHLFNPQCAVRNLLDDIKKRCKCDKDVMVDLSDEHGDVKNLPENPTLYASQFLEGRGVFILIKVEKDEQDRPATYTPLLNNLGLYNPKALERLEDLSRGPTSSSSRNSRRSSQHWQNIGKNVRKLSKPGRTRRNNSISSQSIDKLSATYPSPKTKRKSTPMVTPLK